jgi:DNA-binding NtrC family response regulator
MKLLVIDDDPVLQRTLQARLQKQGYEVTVASDGETALAIWQQDFHPVVLLDLMLPGMDGLHVCRSIRAHARGQECVVVVVTARDTQDDLHEVLDSGADDYLAKPVQLDTLTVRLSIAVRRYRDLVARHRAEERAQAADLQLAGVLAGAPLLVLGVDPELRIDFARGQLQADRRADDLQGMAWVEAFGDQPEVSRDLQKALRGQTFHAQRSLADRTWDLWFSPRVGCDQQVQGVRVIGTDVTGLADAEARLRRHSEALTSERDEVRALLSTLRTGVVVLDHAQQIVWLNATARRLLGVQNDTLGKTWEDLPCLEAADRLRLRGNTALRAAERERLALALQTRSGQTHHVELDVVDAPRGFGAHVWLVHDQTEVHGLRHLMDDRSRTLAFLGRSGAAQVVQQQIRDAAQVAWPVLLEGPSGAGVRTVARSIHQQSYRPLERWAVMDCRTLGDAGMADIVENLQRGELPTPWQQAAGGTLLLDHIDTMGPAGQFALLDYLRHLEMAPAESLTDHPRLLVGTRIPLGEAVERGDFATALFAQLRALRLRIPSLRERREDIPMLAHAFCRTMALTQGEREAEFSREAMLALMQHRWPGQVAELRSIVEAAAVTCHRGRIEVEDLPAELRQSTLLQTDRPVVDERQQILDAIDRAGGNRKRAAELLGMSRATLYRRLDRYGISRADEVR